jgi:hypothetical protein
VKRNLNITMVKNDKWSFSAYPGFTESRRKAMVKERNK